MANTKSVGEISEAVVMTEFLKAGFPVLLPFGENARYDMVVGADGRFLRVQCKTASPCGWQGDRSCLRSRITGTSGTSPILATSKYRRTSRIRTRMRAPLPENGYG